MSGVAKRAVAKVVHQDEEQVGARIGFGGGQGSHQRRGGETGQRFAAGQEAIGHSDILYRSAFGVWSSRPLVVLRSVRAHSAPGFDGFADFALTFSRRGSI